MKNRNRKGQFSHLDREYPTAAERREFRAAESQLIATFKPIEIEVHTADNRREREIAALKAKRDKAVKIGNGRGAMIARIYQEEIERLSR
jgi:hypothetical protein